MTAGLGRIVRLASRPISSPRAENFRVDTVEVGDAGAHGLVVHNTWMSLDPALRLRLAGTASYAQPIQIGDDLDGAAVGVVVSCPDGPFTVGDTVTHRRGWRDFAEFSAGEIESASIERIDTTAADPQAYLGLLGNSGLTAFVGLTDVARIAALETVFVSGAAGGVGSLAGQIAKLYGCTVIGSAGSDEKARFLVEELGFDSAFNYRRETVSDALAARAPGGIDVCFDNVGGEHLEAALSAMRVHGRAALCGTVSSYNDSGATSVQRNEFQIVAKRLSIQGFLLADHRDSATRFGAIAKQWLQDGLIRHVESVTEGLENAPHAFIDMLNGVNVGKALIKI